jgi:DNA-binding protein Fis
VNQAAKQPTQIGAEIPSSVLDPLRARLLNDDESAARRHRLDMGEWPKRLERSGIELDDDAHDAIVNDRCRPEAPLVRVERWFAKRHPNPLRRFDADPTVPPWIFLCGPRGVGKSTAAGWVLARLGGIACTMSMLLGDFNAWKRARPDERYTCAFDRYKRANVLVLDEIGMERDRDADNAREAFFALVNGRQSRKLDTLVLTNLSKPMLVERIRSGTYDERSHDRLRALAVVLGFEGESLRRSVPGGGL